MTADAAKVLERARRQVAELLLGAERDLALAALDRLARSASAPGARSLATLSAFDQRNEILRRAALEHFPQLSRNQQSHELALRLNRYGADTWPRYRGAEECPPRHLGKLQAACWEICRLGFIKLSQDSIYRILCERPGALR